MYAGPVLTSKLYTLTAWIKFQPIIGGIATAIAWNNDPLNYDMTEDRLLYLIQSKTLEKLTDSLLPDPLTNLKRFRDFENRFKVYLWNIKGSAGTSLLYIMRKNSLVTEADRQGTVRPDTNGTYKDWENYMIRWCTTHSGTHFKQDNDAFYAILYSLVKGVLISPM